MKVSNSFFLNEESLLENASSGDLEAFSQLYLHYYPKLFKFINGMLNSKEDSEEILQDIFVHILEKKEQLTKIKSFNSYLYKCAKHRLINRHEHNLVKQKADHYLKNTIESSSRSVEELMISEQYESAFANALDLMPHNRRLVFEMKTVQKLSHERIAIKLQISKSMVK